MNTSAERCSPIPALLLMAIGLAVLIAFSQHALKGHVGQHNASTLWSRYERQGCKPLLYYGCQGQQKNLLICGVDPEKDLYGGLWIGLQGGKVVMTGHAARWAYWQSKINGGCNIPIAVMP